ncbi:hypothetical protein B0H17DRAFT_1205792 [Mycena rosella]|uniref:NADP-dependent oxidoreductase domain-containing protein n=1 Tax=Mycena rosella TaxID=1033263 RepID=A0AAD7D7Z0_MYCRO|nr:hypothetical protein B0H17DRAFT_1205792 [Mycena rosella]
MHKAPFVYPIIGSRKVEHLMANIEALDITLTAEHIAYIESILPFDTGFPSDFLSGYPFLISLFAMYDPQPLLPPVAAAN